MTRIFISMLPAGSKHTLTYNADDVKFVITLDRSQKVSDSYSFYLYSSELALVDNAETGDGRVERGRRSLTMTLTTPSVWMPGSYFLLMRNSEGAVLRFDITLDSHAVFTAGEPRLCPRMSTEDILTSALCKRLQLWQRLSRRPGMRELKQWAVRRCQENEVNDCRHTATGSSISYPANLLITARCDRMATTATMLKNAAGIGGELVSVNCNMLYNPMSNDPYEKLRSTFDELSSSDNILGFSMSKADCFTFSFYHLGALCEGGGRVIMKEIMRHWPGGGNSCIMTGTQQELDALLEQYPSLSQHFPKQNRLREQPYSLEEMVNVFFNETSIAKLMLTAEAKDKACRLLADAYGNGIIREWTADDMRRYVEGTLTPTYLRNTISRVSSGRQTEQPFMVLPEDIEPLQQPSATDSFDEAMKELNTMVGLDNVKSSLTTLSHRMRFFTERRQLGLPTSNDASYHAVFTGNPGTGKTTVARLLGQVYKSLGLLSRGDVISVDRTRIVGRYIGETEDNMRQILKEAHGNVLFIDEAYTLYSKDDAKDFGKHAIETLLDVLSQKHPDMLVILAGYEHEMDELLSMNPGLKGRFPYKFKFSDYTADELLEIAERLLAADAYELTEEARALLARMTREAVSRRDKHFANARWIGQLVSNGIIPALADRIQRTPHAIERNVYQRIEATDIAVAFERFQSLSATTQQRRAIGFCA